MFKTIQNIRKKCAKFYRADFHVHSPLSYDWNNKELDGIRDSNFDRISSTEISDDSVEAFCRKCKDLNLNIVAITDHMKYSFASKCSEYAKNKFSDLLILPGIELNVK